MLEFYSMLLPALSRYETRFSLYIYIIYVQLKTYLYCLQALVAIIQSGNVVGVYISLVRIPVVLSRGCKI